MQNDTTPCEDGRERARRSRESRLRARLHKLLRVQPIADIHFSSSFFFNTQVSGQKVSVASWPATRYHIFWPAQLKRIVPAFNHCAVLAQIFKARPWKRIVVVREFDNIVFLALTPFVWWFRRNLVLHVNGNNFSMPLTQGMRARAMGLLSRMGFNFLLLDGEPVRTDVEHAFPGLRLATPLFPILPYQGPAPARQPRPDGRFAVGFVGNFRADKGGLAAALDAIRRIADLDGVVVRAGFWNAGQRANFAAQADSRVELCSTLTDDEYIAFFTSCDALVILAEKGAYYYRHSSVMYDAIRHGTIPIVPKYPVFQSMAQVPMQIGVTYDGMDDLPRAVAEARDACGRLRANFPAYIAARSPAPIAAAIEGLVKPPQYAQPQPVKD